MRLLLIVNPAASSVTPRRRTAVERVLRGGTDIDGTHHELEVVETTARGDARVRGGLHAKASTWWWSSRVTARSTRRPTGWPPVRPRSRRSREGPPTCSPGPSALRTTLWPRPRNCCRRSRAGRSGGWGSVPPLPRCGHAEVPLPSRGGVRRRGHQPHGAASFREALRRAPCVRGDRLRHLAPTLRPQP